AQAQTFLNGSFEKNTGCIGDQINLSNIDCNAKLTEINSFGTYGDIDIISSAIYGGSGAQQGNWYLGMTGGGTDMIAFTLSEPLVKGKTYIISYYDRKTDSYSVGPVQIGLSTNNNTLGTVVYTGSEMGTQKTWTQHTFTFTAPISGQFITVQMSTGTISDWINLDNFVLKPTSCGGELNILTSATSITTGGTATFTVTGGSEYLWSSAETLTSSVCGIATAKPLVTTIYTVTSHQKNCPVVTATISLTVDPIKVIKEETFFMNDTTHAVLIKPVTKHRKTLFNSHRINGRKFFIRESLTVANNQIKIQVWDKNRADGDKISIYLNGKLILENFTVTKTKKEIFLDLQPGKNILVIHALNLGLIPPNTTALSLCEGPRPKLITLVSTLKKSGALQINYDPVVFKYN
ncbi:MAG: hypothetical protein JWO32_3008, partial [Bacteroidetes bacterium]|nr:hypothetical protein [Bacteroidota bacterium]